MPCSARPSRWSQAWRFSGGRPPPENRCKIIGALQSVLPPARSSALANSRALHTVLRHFAPALRGGTMARGAPQLRPATKPLELQSSSHAGLAGGALQNGGRNSEVGRKPSVEISDLCQPLSDPRFAVGGCPASWQHSAYSPLPIALSRHSPKANQITARVEGWEEP